MAEMITIQEFDGKPSDNKLVILNFEKTETGKTKSLVDITCDLSNKDKKVFHVVFDTNNNLELTKFTDANSEVDNIRLIKVNFHTAVKDTHEIYSGEMVYYIGELLVAEAGHMPQVVVIDSADEIVGTNVVNRLLRMANELNFDIYTATSLKSKNYSVI